MQVPAISVQMYEIPGNYPQSAQSLGLQQAQVAPSGPVDHLRQMKGRLESDLARVTAALDALEKDPEIADVMQLVGQALNSCR